MTHKPIVPPSGGDDVLRHTPTRDLYTWAPGQPTLDNLAKDIYHVLDTTSEHHADTGLAAGYAMRIGGEMAKASVKRDRPRQMGKLWASDLGKKCLRQHWYNFNEPQYGDPIDGHTKFKFLYGNILEEAVLYFAEEAGHTVAYPQHTVEFLTTEGWTIRGRIDAVIDGKLIDVKSTSSYGYKRYKDGITLANDSFGYLFQLGFYTRFNDITPTPLDGGFVWIDKQNGNICYTAVELPHKGTIIGKASDIIDAVQQNESDVAKAFSPEPYGTSGNEKLPIACAYCPFKARCWRDSNNGSGIRTFIYAQGPVFFTTVKREPNCPEDTSESTNS